MSTALCPGSFDPPTNGHVDVIKRCLTIFDHVVVAIVANPSKSSLFDSKERTEMLEEFFEYELQMAQMNESLAGINTLFLPTNPEYGYLSSSLVKEVARMGGSVDGLVPPLVAAALKERYP